MLILLACCWLTATGPALAGDAQVYQWVDSVGVTHFSDRPPVGEQQAVKVLALPAPAPPDARRQAELQAWVAEVNQRVNRSIRQDQEYRLKREAIRERLPIFR